MVKQVGTSSTATNGIVASQLLANHYNQMRMQGMRLPRTSRHRHLRNLRCQEHPQLSAREQVIAAIDEALALINEGLPAAAGQEETSSSSAGVSAEEQEGSSSDHQESSSKDQGSRAPSNDAADHQ